MARGRSDRLTRLDPATAIARAGKSGRAGASVGVTGELPDYLNRSANDESLRDDINVLEANFASLIARLAETLQRARENENDSRRDQRVARIIDEFAQDHPQGSLRNRSPA